MTEENKNHFIYRHHFPDIKSILQRKEKTTKEIFKEAIFVLDSSTLLAPYNTGKEDSEEIKKVYKTLISKNRLYIPEHALREFAKNRSIKISELFTVIDSHLSTIPSIKVFNYPILGELEPYKKLEASRIEAVAKIKEYKQSLAEVKEVVIKWNWSDPVSLMYQNIFNVDILLKPSSNEEDLIEEYKERIDNEIPPGNKDKLKENNAIGDFVIWKCILELGKKENKDIIFISNDEKNDWHLKGNKESISTKFELVDEFYRYTGGNNFISMNFKTFLDYQGVNIEFIEISRNFNNNLKNHFIIKENIAINSLREIEKLINDFISKIQNDPYKSIYISDELNEFINNFKKSYKHEHSGTKDWNYSSSYFFILEELLTNINSLNNRIQFDELIMTDDTRKERSRLITLCKEFLNKYSEFTLF